MSAVPLRLVPAYLRAAWVAFAVAAAAAAVSSLARSGWDDPGAMSAIGFQAAVGGVAGAVIGAAVVTVATVRAGGWRGRVGRVLLAVAIGALLTLAAIALLGRGRLDGAAPFVALGALVGLAQALVAELAAASSRGDHGDDPDIGSLLLVLAGGIGGLIFAGTVVLLLQDGLRYGCSWAPDGEAAGWTCARDGLSLVSPLFGFGGVAALATAAGVTLVTGRVRRADPFLLAGLACAVLLAAAGFTWHVATDLALSFPPGDDPKDAWVRLVLPWLVVAVGGALLVTASGVLRGRIALVTALGGGMLLLAAAVLQVGLLVALLPAAGLVAASLVRTHLLRAPTVGSGARAGYPDRAEGDVPALAPGVRGVRE